jgi:hypothetical protein
MEYKVGGHLPDPDDDRSLNTYWSFEAQLRPHLAAGSGDADLRPYASPRHDQKNTHSCAAQATVKALENLERQKLCREQGIAPEALPPDAHKNLSVLSLYYLSREQMRPSSVHEDSGTYISLACDCLRRFGVCLEQTWPFDPINPRLFESPSIMAMREMFDHKISAYYRITLEGQDRVNSVIEALRGNRPVVYGTEAGDNWFHYQANEVLQLPASVRGGHATHLVGWDNSRAVFIGENSWGTAWGDDGYYLIAPEVIADPCSRDFWVITGSWEEVHPR